MPRSVASRELNNTKRALAENPSSTECPSFEQALAALEKIVHDLEDGRLGLTESLARYEEGVKLLKQCYLQLEQAQRRVELVTGIDSAGNPITRPFDDHATLPIGQEEAFPRSRRGDRSWDTSATESEPGSGNRPPAMDEPGSLF